MSEYWKKPNWHNEFMRLQTMDSSNDDSCVTVDIRARKLADAEIAHMRRSQRIELRRPHIRPWGIAAGAQPCRRSASSAVGWWAIVATVAVCAAVIGAALGITPTFF